MGVLIKDEYNSVLRMRRGKTVLTTGAFEIIHPGHVKLFEEAKRIGGEGSRLVVVVARDETIRRRKGREPILNEEHRRYLVSMLKPVDKAILGHYPPSFEEVIKEVKPDIVVFGYDQDELMREFVEFAEKRGLKFDIVKAHKYSFPDYPSTSKIVEKIIRIFSEKDFQDMRHP